jgi:hypothetical protein
MRVRVAGFVLALGCLVAACSGGGGGKASFVPGAGTGPNASSSNAPASQKSTRAAISLYVPPAAKQDARRKPFYISSATQSFAVAVLPVGSSATPGPGNAQIFPVTTPSPCVAASGGGETCTLTVTAPVGSDTFYVAAFATASPNANASPLSAFVSGAVNVSLSPSPGASPLSFTLNGVVNEAVVSVPSPDASNTPNTQVVPALVATAVPLNIAALDVTGSNVMSPANLPFYAPIVINASPAAEGLTLALSSASVCSSSASGAQASIGCAGDLAIVEAKYDGTPHPDASDHLYDTFSIEATAQPSPAPSPANIVLGSNMLQWTLASNVEDVPGGLLSSMSNGQLFWMAYNETAGNIQTGTFNGSTETATGPNNITDGLDYAYSVAFGPDGSYWIAGNGTSGVNTLFCYTSTSATAYTYAFSPTYLGYADVAPGSVTIDSAGNFWYAGIQNNYDGGGPAAPTFLGYFTSSGCAAPTQTSTQYGVNEDYGDGSPHLTPVSTGGIAMQSDSSTTATVGNNGGYPTIGNALWLVSTSAQNSPSPIATPLNNPGALGNGIAGDGAGNLYSIWSGTSYDDIEKFANGASTFTELFETPPTPPPSSMPNPEPYGPVVFSPTGGAADRLMYYDDAYEAVGLVESLSSPVPSLVSLPNSDEVLGVAYASGGGEYALDMDATPNVNMVRIIPTSTWWVPNVTLNSGCSSNGLLTILERGDSGPFTVTVPGSAVTATQLPGADHDFYLTNIGSSSSATFTASVTDKHGRTENFTITQAASYITCGLRGKRPVKGLTRHRTHW